MTANTQRKKHSKIKTVDFYFDIVCPFAYLGSTQINALCAKYNVRPTWKPVLLAGLYQHSKAPQGKHKSSSSVMAPAKRVYFGRAQKFQVQRLQNVVQNFPRKYPVKTVSVMRLLTAMTDNEQRIACAQEMFSDFWIDNRDMNDKQYLTQIANKYNMDVNLMFTNERIKQELYTNTKNAVDAHCMFGVPAVIINDKEMFWGIDRYPLVEQYIRKGCLDECPVARITAIPPIPSANTIEFYFDFASPWAFLGYHRLSELVPYASHIVLKPVLLGAIFRSVGTHNTPMATVSPIKRTYMQKDMHRWFNQCAGLRTKFPTNFPLRTILPLRVFIIDNRTIDCIYRAGWQSNVNIGVEAELKQVLNQNGFDGDALIARAKTDVNVKNVLRANTDFAVSKGMFGVPTYVVNADYSRFLWGQDRLDWVKDLCCGWKPDVIGKSNL